MEQYLAIVVSFGAGLTMGLIPAAFFLIKWGKEISRRKGMGAYFRELGFAPEECQQHHLPGDCPLCGAV